MYSVVCDRFGRFGRVLSDFCDFSDCCIGGRFFGLLFVPAFFSGVLHDCGVFGWVSKLFVGSAKPLFGIWGVFCAVFLVVFGRFLPLFWRFGARRRLFGREIFVE